MTLTFGMVILGKTPIHDLRVISAIFLVHIFAIRHIYVDVQLYVLAPLATIRWSFHSTLFWLNQTRCRERCVNVLRTRINVTYWCKKFSDQQKLLLLLLIYEAAKFVIVHLINFHQIGQREQKPLEWTVIFVWNQTNFTHLNQWIGVNLNTESLLINMSLLLLFSKLWWITYSCLNSMKVIQKNERCMME